MRLFRTKGESIIGPAWPPALAGPLGHYFSGLNGVVSALAKGHNCICAKFSSVFTDRLHS